MKKTYQKPAILWLFSETYDFMLAGSQPKVYSGEFGSRKGGAFDDAYTDFWSEDEETDE